MQCDRDGAHTRTIKVWCRQAVCDHVPECQEHRLDLPLKSIILNEMMTCTCCCVNVEGADRVTRDT